MDAPSDDDVRQLLMQTQRRLDIQFAALLSRQIVTEAWLCELLAKEHSVTVDDTRRRLADIQAETSQKMADHLSTQPSDTIATFQLPPVPGFAPGVEPESDN